MFGIALVDKPHGMSSHDAIYKARRALGVRKIGHAGTLDPNATGLLLIAVGEATRFLQYIDTEPKEYEAVALLGVSTTTQDSEGESVATADASGVSIESARKAAEAFTGVIHQIPPMFSAVKVDGQRLYKLARKGQEVERAARTVTVHEFEIQSLAASELSFRVVCSGGTYVRTLASDLGDALGVGAHLISLRRTRLGRFVVGSSKSPENLSAADLVSLEDALAPMPAIRLPAPDLERARHGGEFAYAAQTPGEHLALLDDDGVFAVATRLDGALWRPERVLPPPVTQK